MAPECTGAREWTQLIEPVCRPAFDVRSPFVLVARQKAAPASQGLRWQALQRQSEQRPVSDSRRLETRQDAFQGLGALKRRPREVALQKRPHFQACSLAPPARFRTCQG